MIPPGSLAAVRRAIRKFVLLEESDPTDLVFLASILANFAPDRDVPVWMVIVGEPASGKTEIVSLIQDWPQAWTLPDSVTDSYFLSWITGATSALFRIQSSGARILYLPDMGALIGARATYQRSIYQQLRGIHDGFLKKSTGGWGRPKKGQEARPAAPLVYGHLIDPSPGKGADALYIALPPSERLGWVSSATPEFYAWQARHHGLGTRFTCFYAHGHRDWADYKQLSQIEELRADKARWRPLAKQAAQEFLDLVIEQMYDFGGVFCSGEVRDRLAAAVKLVQRIVGTKQITDTGARLHPRLVLVCRMMAFMAGKTQVEQYELGVGLRMATSQLGPQEQRVLAFALSRAEPWQVQELLDFAGGQRHQYDKALSGMLDAGVLERRGRAGWYGYRWQITPKAKELVEVFDPAQKAVAG